MKKEIPKCRVSLGLMQNNKAADEGGFTAELYKALDSDGVKHLTRVFNQVLANELDVPEEWFENSYVMIPKTTRPTTTADDYRAIAILPVSYKLFTRALMVKFRDNISESA